MGLDPAQPPIRHILAVVRWLSTHNQIIHMYNLVQKTVVGRQIRRVRELSSREAMVTIASHKLYR